MPGFEEAVTTGEDAESGLGQSDPAHHREHQVPASGHIVKRSDHDPGREPATRLPAATGASPLQTYRRKRNALTTLTIRPVPRSLAVIATLSFDRR